VDGNAKTVKPTERVPLTGSTYGTVKTVENVGTVAENVDGNAKTLNPAKTVNPTERVPLTANASGTVQTAENWAKTAENWAKTWTETRKR
jgi:hypothetical protein